MQLQVINSNSAGNAYILTNGKEALLIECGVNFNHIKKALDFDLQKVVGCIVTHEHKDHCKAAFDVMAAGIYLYATLGTHEAMGTALHHRSKLVQKETTFKAGGFKIKAYTVQHDAAEPVCYLIHHRDCGTVLFLTDSYYCAYNFTGLNNVIIEANYCQQILDKRLEAGEDKKFLRDRVLQSHMSLATCKDTLKTYDLNAVQNIVLVHLSDRNSDADRFKKEVQQATGKMVHVATPGLQINFNHTPF